MHHPRHSPTQAFTLVELSIVLVIIGLLAGGILAGQSLIRQAELRSVIKQYNDYVAATNSFHDQYHGLPGDIKNATTLWGTGTCPGTSTTGSTTPATCNGNGDGALDQTNTNSQEYFRYWQQLSNAGLIEGAYNGVSANDSYFWSSASSNSASGKISTTVWSTYTTDNTAGTFAAKIFAVNLKNFYVLGIPGSANWNFSPFLTPREARNIDAKIDDGLPASGKVLGLVANSCTSAAINTDFTAVYLLTGTDKTCSLQFPDAY